MADIVLTEEQASELRKCPDGLIRVRDPEGRILGRFHPDFTPEFVAEMKRRARSRGPWYTSEQISRLFDELEAEKERLGSLDDAQIEAVLARMETIDPGHMRPGSSAVASSL
jgi:hypothetical protein